MTESYKVYFYDNNGYEIFTRVYVINSSVNSLAHLVKALFETLINNDDAYSYYIERVEQ